MRWGAVGPRRGIHGDGAERVFAYKYDNGLFVEVLRRHELTEQLIEIQSRMRMSLALVMDRCRPSGVIRDDITPDDLFTLMGGISLSLNADRASAIRWQRGADLLLMALGFPPQLVLQGREPSPS